MPLYEYECLSCGRRTEVLQRMSDAPLATCPQCGGEVKKLVSAPAVQFKGTGWYVTDYAGKKGGTSGPTKTDSKGDDGGKSESKSESSGGSSATETKSSAPSAPAKSSE